MYRALIVLMMPLIASGQTVVSVLAVRAVGEVDTNSASGLTPFVRDAVCSIEGVTCRAAGEDLISALAEIGFGMTGAVDPAQAAEAGKIIAVDEVVTGELARFGEKYTLFLQRVRVEDARVIATGSATLLVEGESDLPHIVRPAVDDLARARTEATRADTTREPEGVAFLGMLVKFVRNPDPGAVLQSGLRVLAVKPGSPAEEAGMRPGMAIVAIDGRPVPRGVVDLARVALFAPRLKLSVVVGRRVKTVVLVRPGEQVRPTRECR